MRQARLVARFASQAWHASRTVGGGICPELNRLEEGFRDSAAVACLSAFGDGFQGVLHIAQSDPKAMDSCTKRSRCASVSSARLMTNDEGKIKPNSHPSCMCNCT